MPLVGAFEGLLLSAYLYLMKELRVWVEVVAVVYVVLHIALTGGMHIDGFADYADVLGSRARGDKAVTILKDPRKGAYSSLLVALLVVASYSLIARTYLNLGGASLVAFVTVSYISAAESMFTASLVGRPEPYQGLAREVTRLAKRRWCVAVNVALYVALIAITYTAIPHPIDTHVLIKFLATASGAPLIGWLTGRDANSRLGFVNGDVLGFCYEVSRLVALLVVSV